MKTYVTREEYWNGLKNEILFTVQNLPELESPELLEIKNNLIHNLIILLANEAMFNKSMMVLSNSDLD